MKRVVMLFRLFPSVAMALCLTLIPVPAWCSSSFNTTVTLTSASPIGDISPLIYGQYLEHVQADEETIYPSLWDNQHRSANPMGIRLDVTSNVAALKVPVVRWPGGCFADVYHWEDAIGPQHNRVPQINRHWGGTEPNQFGTDEFLHWCHLSSTTPYINVNLGTGTIPEAVRWLEYCNGAKDTPQGARRSSNGRDEPWDVKYWGIGNETWGHWEAGHSDADTYGTSLSVWAKAMRRQDPTIKILGVGSEEGNDRAWDSAVLSKAGQDIDLLTVHMYGVSTVYAGSEYEAFVFTPDYLENRLRRMIETVDQATSSLNRATPINLSIDEWNIRHFYDGKQNRKSPRTLQDSIFIGSFFNAMIRLSPRVHMANHVFLVNGNATLLVNKDLVVWTPAAYLFKQYAEWMQGAALPVLVEGPTVEPPVPITAAPGRKPPADFVNGQRNWLDATAAMRKDGRLTISLINKHPENEAAVSLVLDSFRKMKIENSWTLHHEDIYAKNDFQKPYNITPVSTELTQSELKWLCPPHSITLLLLGN